MVSLQSHGELFQGEKTKQVYQLQNSARSRVVEINIPANRLLLSVRNFFGIGRWRTCTFKTHNCDMYLQTCKASSIFTAIEINPDID